MKSRLPLSVPLLAVPLLSACDEPVHEDLSDDEVRAEAELNDDAPLESGIEGPDAIQDGDGFADLESLVGTQLDIKSPGAPLAYNFQNRLIGVRGDVAFFTVWEPTFSCLHVHNSGMGTYVSNVCKFIGGYLNVAAIPFYSNCNSLQRGRMVSFSCKSF